MRMLSGDLWGNIFLYIFITNTNRDSLSWAFRPYLPHSLTCGDVSTNNTLYRVVYIATENWFSATQSFVCQKVADIKEMLIVYQQYYNNLTCSFLWSTIVAISSFTIISGNLILFLTLKWYLRFNLI